MEYPCDEMTIHWPFQHNKAVNDFPMTKIAETTWHMEEQPRNSWNGIYTGVQYIYCRADKAWPFQNQWWNDTTTSAHSNLPFFDDNKCWIEISYYRGATIDRWNGFYTGNSSNLFQQWISKVLDLIISCQHNCLHGQSFSPCTISFQQFLTWGNHSKFEVLIWSLSFQH